MDNPQDTLDEPKSNNDNNKLPIIINPRKRRVPGPAGLLPDVKKSHNETVSSFLNDDVQDEEKKRRRQLEIEHELSLVLPLSSQEEKNKYLTQAPWIEIKRFLQDDPEACKIMKVVKDISWIHNYARKLIICKAIPFLIVMLRATPRYPLKKVEEKVLVVKVFDHSGTIEMALPGSIVKKYNPLLLPGTVLVVKHAGLLHRKRRDVLLEIVENNVIYIASNSKIPEKTKTSSIMDNYKENDLTNFDMVRETSDGLRIIKVSKKPFSYETLIQDYRKLTDPKLINDELGEYKREILEDDYDFNSHTYNNPKIESDTVTRYRELIHRSPWKISQKSKSSNNSGAKYSSSYSNNFSTNQTNNNRDITRSLFNVHNNHNSVNKSNEISNTNESNKNEETQNTAAASSSSVSGNYLLSSEPSSESSNDSNESINCNKNNNDNNNSNTNENSIKDPLAEENTERIDNANTELIDIMDDADDEELVRFMDMLVPGDLVTNSISLETPNQNSVHEHSNNHENNQHQQGDKLENNQLVGEFPDDDEDDAFLANINIG